MAVGFLIHPPLSTIEANNLSNNLRPDRYEISPSQVTAKYAPAEGLRNEGQAELRETLQVALANIGWSESLIPV